jgi:hypothetical protein
MSIPVYVQQFCALSLIVPADVGRASASAAITICGDQIRVF